MKHFLTVFFNNSHCFNNSAKEKQPLAKMDNNAYICILKHATLAQSVEQRIRNAQVASSSLTSGSTKKRRASMPSAFSFVILPDIVETVRFTDSSNGLHGCRYGFSWCQYILSVSWNR